MWTDKRLKFEYQERKEKEMVSKGELTTSEKKSYIVQIMSI